MTGNKACSWQHKARFQQGKVKGLYLKCWQWEPDLHQSWRKSTIRGMKASGMSVCTQRTPETQEAGEELKNGFWAWRQNESERTWKLLSHVQLFATVYIVHGILQPRILEWVAFPFSRGSSQPRDWTRISCIAGRFFTNWAIRESEMRRVEKKKGKSQDQSEVLGLTWQRRKWRSRSKLFQTS